MKILNLYYSATGNTDKVAVQIERAARKESHEVTTVKVPKILNRIFLLMTLSLSVQESICGCLASR